MNDQVIRVLITAHDKASATFAKVRASALAMGDGLKGVDRDGDAASKTMYKIGNAARSMHSDLSKAGEALRGFGLGGAILTNLPVIIGLVVQLSAQLVELLLLS